MSNLNYMNPWKDILSYESCDQNLFKGRSEDVAKFLNHLDDGSFSVIYSSSGIGKTSFLNAAIEPLMRKKGYIPIHIFFHMKDNVEYEVIKTIEEKLTEAGFTWQPSFIEWESIKDVNESDFQTICEQSLWWRLRTYKVVPVDDKEICEYQPLLVFDQFEEVLRKTDANFLIQETRIQTRVSLEFSAPTSI